MKKTKSFIAFLLAVVLVVSQCIIVTSYAFASDDEAENGIEVAAEVENAEDQEEPQADKVIIGVDGYDFLGDKPYQTLAAIYGAELDTIPFPETLPVSIDGTSELVKLPVEWKLADGEEWDAYSQVYDEEGNLISSKVVADFGEGYVLSEELADNGAMPWINLIHQPKPLVEETAEDSAPAEETTKAETKAPVKAPSKAPSKTPAMLSNNNIATYASLPDSEQSSYVYYSTNWTKECAFEIKGVSGGSANIKTTFSENGYTCAFKVDGAESNVLFKGNGVTKTVNGMQITQTLSIVNDDAYIKINYDVYNPTTVAHTIGIANHCDVQIGSNDSAPIYPTGTGIRMAQGTAANDPQFNMICKNAYGVTDVDTLWYGKYNERTSHLWTGEKTSSTLTGTDSGFSIAWYNRVINPGQTKTYSYLLGVGKSANPPELGSEISAIVNLQTVDVSASVKDLTGMVDKLYYVLDTKNGNGTYQNMGGVIQRPTAWQAGEVHTVSVWVMNDANAMSPIKTVSVFIEDNEELGDVMRPAQEATVTFAANGGSGSAPATINAYELQTVTLPNNTFTAPTGKTFGGWQDPSGNVYPAGSDYKIPETETHTTQLKAYWINTNESFYYLDTYEEQLNGTYKKTNGTITSGTVGTAVNVSASGLTVPEGMQLNTSKSKLSGTIANASNPLHLEAYFDRISLTVTFDNGLSDKANDTVTVKYGATVAENDIKTLANQTYATFGGWFTSIGGKGNAFTSERKIRDNTTVYAYWIPKTINVDFDYNYTNPRLHNFETREYSCRLTPTVNADYESNLAGKVANFPPEPTRWQDTDGNIFRFDGWYLDDDTKVESSTLLEYKPTTLTAKWIKSVSITCVAEGNGTVTGQGIYDIGSDAEVTWAPDPGYHISHVLIDGKWVGGDHIDNPSHLFEDLSENHNVLVSFDEDEDDNPDPDVPDVIIPEDKYYLITTQKHGTSKIELTDSFSVKEGETARFEWSVPSGYKITKILVNGLNRDQSVIDRGYGEIENVRGNHVVEVFAEPVTSFVQQNGYFSVNTAINHGTITNSASVTEGSDFTVEWQVEEGYHAVKVLIDGAEAADIDITSNTFNNIDANHTVEVICEPDDPSQVPDDNDDNRLFVDTAIYGGPGSITPSSFVSTGDNTTVTWDITADIPEQYEIGYVYVDNEIVDLDEDDKLSYTFDDIDSDHKVEVYLIPNLVQFNVEYEGKGTVSPSQTLLYGTDYGWFNADPAAGWELSSIIMDGVQIYPEPVSLFSRIASFFSLNDDVTAHSEDGFEQEFKNIVDTHNVYVTFSRDDGTIDIGSRIKLNTELNGNGTISPSRIFMPGRDDDDTVEWNVPDNYEIDSIYAKNDDTDYLTPIPVSGNSVTLKDILDALQIATGDSEISTIDFIVNTKPIPVPTAEEPIEYFNLSTKIDDGGNITSSMNNLPNGEVVTVNWSTDEEQWISKVIIDGEERPDLIEKNSVDLTMDQDHSVEVVLNLAESKYYLETYMQNLDGEYELVNSYPFDSRVKRTITLNPDTVANGSFAIDGFTFNSEKSVLSGTVTGLSKPLRLKAYFDRVMTLHVEYLNEDGVDIAEGYSETYKLNEKYEAKAADPKPYGYTLKEIPANAEGRMTEDDITVQYVYTPSDATVLVNYLDENGNKIPAEIQDSTVIHGKVFDTYKTTAKQIYGYKLDTSRMPVQEGTFEEEQQVVNYYYTLKDSSVVFKFLCEHGDEVGPQKVINGKVHDDYTDAAQEFLDEFLTSYADYGYELAEEPVLPHDGKMAENQITVVFRFNRKTAQVEVKYVDEDGNKIDDTLILEGYVLETYETSPRDLTGYTLVNTPENASGTFINGKTTVTYTYKANGASVLVNYKGTDGEQLDRVMLSGQVSQNYSTDAKKFKGYHLTAVPANAEGKYESELVIVNYIYAPDDNSLTVNYLNKDGKAVADSSAQSGKVNQSYSTTSKVVYGYDLVDVPKNASGKFTKDPIVVNYIYDVKDAVVTVNYVDINGEPLAESETINGKYFDDYKTTEKSISGYQLTATPSNSRGEMNADEVIVDYVYVPKDTSVIVNYVNTNGKSIAKSEALNGEVSKPYTTEAKDVFGYTLTGIPENATGEFTGHQIVVNYVYDVKDAVVIANYVDINGNKLAESETINGKYFDEYSTTSKKIPGYKLTAIPANASGEINADEIIVDYVYALKDASVIVNYIDKQGKSIAKSEMLNGKAFESYTTEAKDIYGYTLIKTPLNASGLFADEQIVVNYIYDTKATKVVVKYVDENGKELAKSDTVKGKVFDEYTTSAKSIYGYKVIAGSKNTTGKMTEDTITVTYTYKQYLNIDTDGDGKPDVDVDTDGDGKPDINIDITGNGKPDINIDTTGDGKPNVNIDTTGNGKPDINIDTTGDGQPDVNIDTDGDGQPDVNIDTDGDGKPDTNIDTDGDGKADTNLVDTGSNDMFSLVFFAGLAMIALVLLFAICKKSKKVSE